MLSCPERRETLSATLASLLACGWEGADVLMDDQVGPTSAERFNVAWHRMLRRAGQARSDFVLLCEDDLIFGNHFRENLQSWPPLRSVTAGAFFGSLYNHGRTRITGGGERYCVADPLFFWGSQALVLTPLTARFLATNWGQGMGNGDVRMARLAAALTPILFHRPSLVQHAPGPSTWGAAAHSAADFDPDWRPGRRPYVPPKVRDA